MLCTGELGSTQVSEVDLHYKNSIIHRIVPQGWIQGGGVLENIKFLELRREIQLKKLITKYSELRRKIKNNYEMFGIKEIN